MQDAPVPDAVLTDRGRRYFGVGSRHYSFYAARISQALDRLAPDVVLGEPTLMHEALIIAECRRRSIPYVHPTMTRYPGGRFQFLREDTQIPAIRSGDTWETSRLLELAEAIGAGRQLPTYMKKQNPVEQRLREIRRLAGQMRTTCGWFRGERFNTPSPVKKLKLRGMSKRNLNLWSQLARMPCSGMRVVLYPLQMQPEANIDVWGRPYNDQAELIVRFLRALPPDSSIAIKANPKSKYEISETLLAVARDEPRVVLLPLDCSMERAQAVSLGTVTVSGTVGLEAVFGRGRCLSLRHPLLDLHLPEFHAKSPEDAIHRLLNEPMAGCGSVVDGVKLLTLLVADSFEGTINEPTYDPRCLSRSNIDNVSKATSRMLNSLRSSQIEKMSK